MNENISFFNRSGDLKNYRYLITVSKDNNMQNNIVKNWEGELQTMVQYMDKKFDDVNLRL
jgi:hypothetical protein